MNTQISKAKKEDFPYIQEKIENYLLDAASIDWRQFFVVRLDGKVAAFGRIIDCGVFFEMASLGVDYYQRKRGLGRMILDFLVQKARRQDVGKPIYAVTHVPDFLASCGFKEVKDDYPEYLGYKRKHLCHLDQSRIKVVKWMG